MSAVETGVDGVEVGEAPAPTEPRPPVQPAAAP